MHPSKTPSEKTQQDPSNPFSSFLYKLIFVSIFIALLPLFPSSESPELSNNSFFARSYELLHLLLVGVAISYGLFSRRNSDPDIEKEALLRPDTPQSYVSEILNVSSVFDDEDVESPKGLDLMGETKGQTWNYSQYYREKPVVVVAQESTDDPDGSTKPMFLPARSLRSFGSAYGSNESLASFTSNQKDDVAKDGKVGRKEGAVLPSPIPWRSRSGKMEVKEESSPLPNASFGKELGSSRTQSFNSPPPHSPPSTASGTELGSSRARSFKSPPYSMPNTAFSAESSSSATRSLKSPPPDSPPNIAFGADLGSSRTQSFKTPSPKSLSPSPSLSQEIGGESSEDLGRRKSFHKPSLPPPPPPPPPPPLNYASHSVSEKRDAGKSFRDELEDLSKRGRRRFGSDSFNAEKVSYAERSVRTVRSREAQGRPALARNQGEKRDEFMEKMIIPSDSESDDDRESSGVEEASDAPSMEAGPHENEVDKKADEFIAKFREQIRLQRIASIKKSSGQRSTRNAK